MPPVASSFAVGSAAPFGVLAAAAPPFLIEIAAVIVAGAVVAYVGYRLGLVPIVGFLLTGVLIGPYGLGVVEDPEMVDALAEVGVILLLFTIGIEFSLDKLAKIQRLIFGGGGLQVALTTGVTAAALAAFGVGWPAAVFTGFLVALSSTAIVLKLLGSRNEQKEEHGQAALGVLIFQDLAIIVMVMLVPMLAGQGGSALDIGWALAKAGAVIVAVLVVARRVMPRVLEVVARTCSQELFLLAVVALCFGTAWLTSLAGVSVALGAFLAGLIVSESRFSEHAFGEIMPLQILFSATFFVSVGLLLDLGFLWANLPLVLGAVVAVLVVKALATAVSVRALGYSTATAAASGLLLAQVGEFSFVLERAGREVGLYPAGLEAGSQAFIAATVLLMIATPGLASLAARVGKKLEASPEVAAAQPDAEVEAPEAASRLENHVVVGGYGRAARRLVRALQSSGVPHVVVTLSPPRAEEAEAEGLVVVRGHPARNHALAAARIGRAKVFLVADDDHETAHQAVAVARALNPSLRILTRSRYHGQARELREAGATCSVAEEMEGLVALYAEVLESYGEAAEAVERRVTRLREGGYDVFQQPGAAEARVSVRERSGEDTRPVVLAEAAEAVGRTLGEVPLPGFGLSLHAAARDGRALGPDDVLQAGDVLTLRGTADAFLEAAPLFRPAGLGADEQGFEEPDAQGAVAVYGASWCALTSGFRTYLRRAEIPFAYYDVEEDAAAAERVRAMNGGKLKFPMVVVGEREMKNPTLDELEAALEAHGLVEA